MSNVSLLLSSGMSATANNRNQAQSASLRERSLAAYQAVSQENRLAAVDYSELSHSCEFSGCFKFDFANSSQSSSTSMSWDGSLNSSISAGQYTTSFSFSFSISHTMQVTMGQGVQVDADQISGDSFSFSNRGVLTLYEQLAERLSEDDGTEADLGGQLTDKLVRLLEKLGLLDNEGKATPSLQFMSDYAGMGRFKAGQQVTAQAGIQYSASMSSRSLSWQGWNQQQTHQIAGNAANGNAVIDDRDVININVINGDNNTVENETNQ